MTRLKTETESDGEAVVQEALAAASELSDEIEAMFEAEKETLASLLEAGPRPSSFV
jgi:hypothetical protein